MTTIVVATRNQHKVQEIRQILGAAYRVWTLDQFPGSPVVAEDADTFAGNACKKTATLAAWIAARPRASLPQEIEEGKAFFVLADDSGLEVDALEGSPGVHSARFAALDVGSANSPDSANNAKLIHLMQTVPANERGARFRCVIALGRLVYSQLQRKFAPFAPNQMMIFEGVCEGSIGFAPSGKNGFGYDPLF
ncbi:MAG TPA: non-canonical purine NTP pyrophosphatase, partial [Pirellulales bacterium]